MSVVNSILLFEPDNNIADDISASLKLINVSVTTASTAREAKLKIIEQRPGIIIVRLCLDGDPEAGADFARELASSGKFKKIPIVSLCSENDKKYLERPENKELFKGTLPIPVEFPLFTQITQDIIHDLIERGELLGEEPEVGEIDSKFVYLKEFNSQFESSEEQAELETTENEGLNENKQEDSTPEEDGVIKVEENAHIPQNASTDERIMLIYKIQIAVLESIRKSRRFKDATVDDIPPLMAAVTSKICTKCMNED